MPGYMDPMQRLVSKPLVTSRVGNVNPKRVEINLSRMVRSSNGIINTIGFLRVGGDSPNLP